MATIRFSDFDDDCFAILASSRRIDVHVGQDGYVLAVCADFDHAFVGQHATLDDVLTAFRVKTRKNFSKVEFGQQRWRIAQGDL
jgi:hypothetical protein